MNRWNLIFGAWCNADLGPAFTFPKWWIHVYGQEGADSRSDTVRYVNSEEKLVIWNMLCWIVAVSRTFFIFLTEPGTVVCVCVCVCVREWVNVSMQMTVHNLIFTNNMQLLCENEYLHCCDKIECMYKTFCILLIYFIWIRGFLTEKIVISNCMIPGWNLNTNCKRKCQNDSYSVQRKKIMLPVWREMSLSEMIFSQQMVQTFVYKCNNWDYVHFGVAFLNLMLFYCFVKKLDIF